MAHPSPAVRVRAQNTRRMLDAGHFHDKKARSASASLSPPRGAVGWLTARCARCADSDGVGAGPRLAHADGGGREHPHDLLAKITEQTSDWEGWRWRRPGPNAAVLRVAVPAGADAARERARHGTAPRGAAADTATATATDTDTDTVNADGGDAACLAVGSKAIQC